MPVVTKDNQRIIVEYSALLQEYGIPRSRTNQWGIVGDLCYNTRKSGVNILCDKCGSYSIRCFKTILKEPRSSLIMSYTLCQQCSIKQTKLRIYGNENFNNRRSAKETIYTKYGKSGVSLKLKGRKRLTAFTEEHKNNLSRALKESYKNGRIHPQTGKSLSSETKAKMIETNSKTWANKVINGDCNWHTGYKSGFIFSKKLNKELHYRSSYEKKFISLLDLTNEEVTEFQMEPFSISYLQKGFEKKYIPDILITYSTGIKHLIEIKPYSLIRNSNNLLKFRAAARYIQQTDISEFFVLCEGDFWRYLITYAPSFFNNLDNSFKESLKNHLKTLFKKELEYA